MNENSIMFAFGVLYFVAFTSSMLAFVMNSMQKLRILTVLSSSCFVFYYYYKPTGTEWLDVASELTLVIINVLMIIYLTWNDSKIKFDQRELFLYKNEFSELTRIEFNRLLEISEWHLEAKGFVYSVEGQTLEDINYLISGDVEAKLPDGTAVTVPPGNVIGEVSFRLQCPASATVTGLNTCMCLRWNQNQLRELCATDNNIKGAVDNVLSLNMARKLSNITEGMPATDTPEVEPG
jgi:CRP-like cAMP-binding protein